MRDPCGIPPVKQVVKCIGSRVLGVWLRRLPSPQRPGLRAHAQAVRLDTPLLVKVLRDLLGAKLVAYLGGVRGTRADRPWAEGTRAVQDKTDEYRLRLATRSRCLPRRKTAPRS